MINHKILIVEDDPKVVVFLEDRIVSMGFEVLVARNGLEGLKEARSQAPSLIILDVMMPEMDGHELCHKLKINPATKHIPILMLTARGQRREIVEGLSIGADDYMTKPYDDAELEARIEALLRRTTTRRTTTRTLFNLKEDGSLSLKNDDHQYLLKLYQLVTDYFTLEEIRTLCFILNIDYDRLRGEEKEAKTRELILLLARQERIDALIAAGANLRPQLSWARI